MKADPRPIGIFDSGLGGLTVLRTLAGEFPNESFLYVGDVARLPYGNKSPETVRKYGEQILRFLIARGVKMLIIACNTASTVFLDDTHFEGIPLFNVIGPGAQAALTHAQGKPVGVIGTTTTIQSHAYLRTLQKLSPSTQVIEAACPLFVPLAEEGLAGDEVTRLMGERYLAPMKAAGVRTLVLGCTHYPLLREDIQKVMGQTVRLIESGEVLALEMKKYFQREGSTAQSGTRQLTFFTTDATGPFEALARKIMAPEQVPTLERIVL